jgi:hypothetical protein
VRVAVAGADVETRADPGTVDGIVSNLVLDALVSAQSGTTVRVEVTDGPEAGLQVRGSAADRRGGRAGGRRLRRARALAEAIGATIVVVPAPGGGRALALRLPPTRDRRAPRKVAEPLPTLFCSAETDADGAPGASPEEGT